MNTVQLSGRVVGEPKLGDNYVHFSVNTGRYDWKEKKTVTNFIKVSLLGDKAAAHFAKNFQAGKAVELAGELEQGTWTNKEGKEVTDYSVKAQRVSFVPRNKDDVATVGGSTAGGSAMPF